MEPKIEVGKRIWAKTEKRRNKRRYDYKIGGVSMFSKATMASYNQRESKWQWWMHQYGNKIGASILRWYFGDWKQGWRSWRHFTSATRAIRQEIAFETEKNLEFVKTQNWSNLKSFISWDRKFVQPPPPNLGRENLSKSRFYHPIRVISKLFMRPTNVLASDPQVWLSAFIWCKKCSFWYFVIYRQSCLFCEFC